VPKDFSRTSRLGEQIQRDLAKMIQFDMKDPRLGMVTLNAVKVAKDLGYADIYFTVMGAKGETDESTEEEIRNNAVKILNDAAGYLRGELARDMKTRTTPALRFHYDESLLRGHRMTNLINKAVAEDKARAGDDSQADEQE
jgi:ribosome-binding factor A